MQDVALNQYFKDLAPLKPLSRGDETELAEQIRRGSVRARDKLVLANLRFVVKIAREYENRGLSLADLISAGNLGLVTAVERFDGTRGFKFISYAVWWIRQAIRQSLSQDVRRGDDVGTVCTQWFNMPLTVCWTSSGVSKGIVVCVPRALSSTILSPYACFISIGFMHSKRVPEILLSIQSVSSSNTIFQIGSEIRVIKHSLVRPVIDG